MNTEIPQRLLMLFLKDFDIIQCVLRSVTSHLENAKTLQKNLYHYEKVA